MDRKGCPFKNGLLNMAEKSCPFIRSLVQTEKDRAELGNKSEFVFLHNEVAFTQVYETFHGEQGVLPHCNAKFRENVFTESEVISSKALPQKRCPFAVESGVPLATTIPIQAASISHSFGLFDQPPGDDNSARMKNLKNLFAFHEKQKSHYEVSADNLRTPPPPKTIQPAENDKSSNDPSSIDPKESFMTSKCPMSRIPIVKNIVGGLVSLEPPGRGKKGKAKTKVMKKLECPQVVVRARAAFAATPAMRALRPQDLYVRIATVAATSLVTNVPLGCWREHLVKFSPAWFVAVHASIPLIIMMRKAVLLPKYAIVATISCAILGQFIGSRAERWRLLQQAIQTNVPISTDSSCRLQNSRIWKVKPLSLSCPGIQVT